MITEMYGGKIDNEGDFKKLGDLVNNIFTPAAYEEDHKLVDGHQQGVEDLTVPSGTRVQDFTEWVKQLPEREPPAYLGLPSNAEKLLLVRQAQTMIEHLARVVQTLDEGEELAADDAQEEA